MIERFEVSGGADPVETAAIAAAVEAWLAGAEAARSLPSLRPRQSAWVLAWRPRPAHPPLDAQAYRDLTEWSPAREED